MSPQHAAKHDDTRDPKNDLEFCPACQQFAWRDHGHHCDAKPRMAWRGPLVALTIMLITILMILGILWIAFSPNAARAQEGAIHPVPAPAALVKARAQCPLDKPLICRASLVHAYEALRWQKHARQQTQAMTVQAITRDAIAWAAAKYHVSAVDMTRVGVCESHLWPFATNGQYAGWAQLSTRHRADPIFAVVPWQDAYAEASHVARYVHAHGWGEWQCQPQGGLRW